MSGLPAMDPGASRTVRLGSFIQGHRLAIGVTLFHGQHRMSKGKRFRAPSKQLLVEYYHQVRSRRIGYPAIGFARLFLSVMLHQP
jgi:hypothetical protein